MFRHFTYKLALILTVTVGAAGVAKAQQTVAAPVPLPAQLNLNSLVADAQGWLSDLIRIDTSNPPGNDLEAAKYVAQVLQKENIPSEVIEIAPGHAAAVGRLQSGPLANPERALLLLAHLDVAGVDKSKWSVDPFAGTVKDGYLYGRGVLDDKGMLAANLAVMVGMKRAGIHLNRDLIFLADDEGWGGVAGVKALVNAHWDKIACGFALNEGGRVVSENGKVQHVAVQASEKVLYNVSVIASGSSGLASVPRPDNAVAHLATAVGKIAALQAPPQLMTITRRYFEQLSQIEDDDTAKWMRALETDRFELAAMRLSEMSPTWGAMLRDTAVPTELRAGGHSAGVPAEAAADLSVSLLPGDSVDALQSQMIKAVNDPQIRFEVQPDAGVAAPPSSVDSELYQTIARVAPQQFSGAAVVPMLSPVTTDLSELRLHNVQAYGLLPFPLSKADEQRIGANDERLSLSSFRAGVEFLVRIVNEFEAPK